MWEDKEKTIGCTEVEGRECSFGLNNFFQIEKQFCWLKLKKAKAKMQKYIEKGGN